MRRSAIAVGVTLLGFWTGGSSHAQGLYDPRFAPPSVPAQPYYSQSSQTLPNVLAANPAEPSAAPAAPGAPTLRASPPAPPTPPSPPSPPMDAAQYPTEYAEQACPPDAAPEPWKLPQPCLFQKLGVNVGGWVQQGYTYNPDDPADGYNGPVTTNDFADQYQLNQAWLYFVRPTNTDGCGWDVGGRFDMTYGTDWRFGQNFGLDMDFNGNDNYYGLVFPQLYAEFAVNNLKVRMGHFAAFTSYEVVPAPLNFFYSHTYMMAGYFDPLLVTGMMADYKLNDNLTLLSGFHRGWMMFEDMNNDLNYLGGIKWLSDSKRTNASLMVDTGAQDVAGEQERTSIIGYLSHELNGRLLIAGQVTMGWENGGATLAPQQDAEWYGFSQWLIWKLNPKWSAGARAEWIRDDDGSRIFGIGEILGTNKGWRSPPGYAGDFYDISLGLNWRPNANWVVRPEVRWDWYDGAPNLVNGQSPFDGGTDNSQTTAAVDLILTF